MVQQRQHYKYRPQKEYRSGIPWHKKVIQRIEKLNKFLFLRLLGKILRIHPVEELIPLEKISSVLIIRYDALGDMIVTTPLWRILKRYRPSIKIGVAGSFKNLDILRADPDIDILYDYTATSLKDFYGISKEVRKQQWDVVLMGNFNQKTRNSVIARLASPHGITATVGSRNTEGHQALFSRLISLPLPVNEMPMTLQLQFLLKSVIALSDVEDERPSIIIDKEIKSSVRSKISAMLDEMHCAQYLILNTDAPTFKKWTIENNLALAEFISGHYPEFGIIVTSLPENGNSIVELLKERHIPRVQYFSTPDIHTMTALIRYSSLIITPDTSIVHLASAENKPVVAFYLSAGEWLPYKIDSYVIIPKKGEQISSIPFGLVKEGVIMMLSEEHKKESPKTRIMRCDDPANLEIRN
ncbi:MAG: glycosyltransferase family 9 protein [Candidatus Kapaibacterium sp.]